MIDPIKINTSENQAIFTRSLDSIDTIVITGNTSTGNFEDKFSIKDTQELSEKLQVVILSTNNLRKWIDFSRESISLNQPNLTVTVSLIWALCKMEIVYPH